MLWQVCKRKVQLCESADFLTGVFVSVGGKNQVPASSVFSTIVTHNMEQDVCVQVHEQKVCAQ